MIPGCIVGKMFEQCLAPVSHAQLFIQSLPCVRGDTLHSVLIMGQSQWIFDWSRRHVT